MDRGRVGDERGSKEIDGCPLTSTSYSSSPSMRVVGGAAQVVGQGWDQEVQGTA
jgi:hypothetical protein